MGMPPWRATAPCSASAATRPCRVWSSKSLLGRRKIAAVRALSIDTFTLATCASSGRRSVINAPPASTTAITGATPRAIASASAARATRSAPASVSTFLSMTACPCWAAVRSIICIDVSPSVQGPRSGERHGLVLVGGLAADANGANRLPLDDERDAALQRHAAGQLQRAEAPVPDLVLELLAGPAEDGRRAGLVHGHVDA